MRTTLKHLRMAVIVTAALAVGGNLAGQGRTNDRLKKRSHRIYAAQTGPDQVTLAWDEVPGTTEYRIYLPDPNQPGPPGPGSRPWSTLSGSGRRAIVTGVRRLSAGAYLEAVADGEVLYRGTFNAVARAPLSPVTPPASVRAQESGETEVTVSWSAVPGATAYMIARAAGGSGWQMACDVCPATTEFVDTLATPGLKHSYSVRAIFPMGVSTGTASNTVLVGAAQLAAATAASQATAAATWDKPLASGTPVAGSEGDNTNVGAGAGTPAGTTTPTGGTTTAGTPTGSGTPTTGTPSGTCPPGTRLVMPKTGTILTKNLDTGAPLPGTEGDNSNAGASGGTSAGTPTTGTCVPINTTDTTTTGGGTAGSAPPMLLPPTNVKAQTSPEFPGTAGITWQPSTSTGVISYTLNRSINGGPMTKLRDVGTAQPYYSDSAFGPELFAAGPVTARYSLVAVAQGGATSAPSNTTPGVSIVPLRADTTPATVLPPTRLDATTQGMRPGSVWVTWGPSPSAEYYGFTLYRSINGAPMSPLQDFGKNQLGATDSAFTAVQFAAGPVKVSYQIAAVGRNNVRSAPSFSTNQLQVQPPGGGTTTPAAAPCKLNYQRADNMWADFGRPDGFLGVESISLANGAAKVFTTDWAYEKKVNDGTNYYGSHLRLATNVGAGAVRLRLRNAASAVFGSPGAALAERIFGANGEWLLMKAGENARFRDDLMEVHCGQ